MIHYGHIGQLTRLFLACLLIAQSMEKHAISLQKLNIRLGGPSRTKVGAKWCLDLNEMEELRNDAYINSKVAKQRMKRWHDQLISNKEFQKGQRVLLYDSRLHIFPRKLKSRWIGPFIIHQVHLNGVVELLNSNSTDTLKSMAIVSNHSWSHSIKIRRKSTSLSHRNPNQKGVKWTWSCQSPCFCFNFVNLRALLIILILILVLIYVIFI